MTPIFFDNMKPHPWAAIEKVGSFLDPDSVALVLTVKSICADKHPEDCNAFHDTNGNIQSLGISETKAPAMPVKAIYLVQNLACFLQDTALAQQTATAGKVEAPKAFSFIFDSCCRESIASASIAQVSGLPHSFSRSTYISLPPSVFFSEEAHQF